MAKVSANYPSYSGSNVGIGGSLASTGVEDGILKNTYKMSDAEGAIYEYTLKTLANVLPQLNTFDTNTQASLQSQVNAYKDSGIEKINSIYNPLIKGLENDVASRFGNLDNSIFTDNLEDIESERSKSISSFAQDILAKQSELESDELTKRYALVEMLNGLSNNIYKNALNAISTALTGSSSANNYNSAVYDALSSIKGTGSSSSSGLSSLMSTITKLPSEAVSLFNFL